MPVKGVKVTDLYRNAADRLRDRGIRATVEAVKANLDKKDLNAKPAKIKRLVCQAIAQDYFRCKPKDMTDKEISHTLGIKYDTFRQYRSRPFHPQSLVLTEDHMTVFKEVINCIPGYNPINLYKAVFSK
jgi:hypothetical protein